MRLRELVAVPQLRIRVLFAEGDALDRPVGWAYTTDLLNPTRYLAEGQLVMTGLMWRRDPSDSMHFVGAVAEAGATALVAGEGLLGFVPDDIVEACRKYQLPLLAVPADVSFAEVTEFIASEAAQDRVSRLTASLVRHRQLLAEVAQGQALDDLAHRFARETGLACWVVSATGRHIVEGAGPLPKSDLDRVTRAAMTAESLPAATLLDGDPRSAYSIFAIGAAGGRGLTGLGRQAADHRATAWYLVVSGQEAQWSPSILDAIGELSAIAALDRGQAEQRLAEWREMADNAVTLLESEPESSDSTLYLRQAGVALDRPLIVAMGDFVGRPELRTVARALLVDAVAHIGRPVVGVGRDGHPVAIIGGREDDPAAPNAADDPDQLLQDLRTALDRVAPALGGARFAVGVSNASGLGALGGALRSARYAWMLGENHADPVHVASSAQVTSAVQLLMTVPDHLRRTFADHVLGPIQDYDRRNDAGLMPTLQAYLDCGGSWSKAAERLHLHLNTVRYRISRVEELTGRDLSSIGDRMDFYFALNTI
jgi:hypothetical protein